MAEWTEQSVRAEIPGWIIEVKPGTVTLASTFASPDMSDGYARGMDLEHAIELRDTLTEAIERTGGATPVGPVPSSRRPGSIDGSFPTIRPWADLLKGFGPLTEVKR